MVVLLSQLSTFNAKSTPIYRVSAESRQATKRNKIHAHTLSFPVYFSSIMKLHVVQPSSTATTHTHTLKSSHRLLNECFMLLEFIYIFTSMLHNDSRLLAFFTLSNSCRLTDSDKWTPIHTSIAMHHYTIHTDRHTHYIIII